jgi:hypothetical protein
MENIKDQEDCGYVGMIEKIIGYQHQQNKKNNGLTLLN